MVVVILPQAAVAAGMCAFPFCSTKETVLTLVYCTREILFVVVKSVECERRNSSVVWKVAHFVESWVVIDKSFSYSVITRR